MPLKKIGEKGGWYKVQDVDKETHWVPKGAVTDNIVCVVVRSKSTRLRTGPGSQFPLADFQVVDKYTPFKKLGREEDWIFLEDDDGQKYWTADASLWQPLTYVQLSF